MTRPVAILTRPAASCGDLESVLKNKGFDVLSTQMIHVEPVQTLEMTGLENAAFIFSSVHAVHILARLFPGRDHPLYVVGAQTAQVAKRFGFQNVCAVAPTGAALVQHILDVYDANQERPLVHVRGRDVAFPVCEKLSEKNIKSRDLIVYSADLVEDLEASVKAALRGGNPLHVFFWSARVAAHFETLAQGAMGEADVLEGATALCLSERIAASLTPRLWGRILRAPTPDRAGMGALVEDLTLGSCAQGVPPA